MLAMWRLGREDARYSDARYPPHTAQLPRACHGLCRIRAVRIGGGYGARAPRPGERHCGQRRNWHQGPRAPSKDRRRPWRSDGWSVASAAPRPPNCRGIRSWSIRDAWRSRSPPPSAGNLGSSARGIRRSQSSRPTGVDTPLTDICAAATRWPTRRRRSAGFRPPLPGSSRRERDATARSSQGMTLDALSTRRSRLERRCPALLVRPLDLERAPRLSRIRRRSLSRQLTSICPEFFSTKAFDSVPGPAANSTPSHGAA